MRNWRKKIIHLYIYI